MIQTLPKQPYAWTSAAYLIILVNVIVEKIRKTKWKHFWRVIFWFWCLHILSQIHLCFCKQQGDEICFQRLSLRTDSEALFEIDKLYAMSSCAHILAKILLFYDPKLFSNNITIYKIRCQAKTNKTSQGCHLIPHSAKRVLDCRQNHHGCRQNKLRLLWNALLTTPYVSEHYKHMFLVARDLYEMLVLSRGKHTSRRSTVGIWSEVRVYRMPATNISWAGVLRLGKFLDKRRLMC